MTKCFVSGGLCCGGWVAAFEEGGRLAPVQKYLRGLVCDGAHLRPHQRRHHGHLHLWHPEMRLCSPGRGGRENRSGTIALKLEGQNISLTSNGQLGKERFAGLWLGCIIYALDFAVCSNWATSLPGGFFLLIQLFCTSQSCKISHPKA